MITFRRFYHVSSTVYNVKKQGLKLNNMINPKQKKQWYNPTTFDLNTLPSVKSLSKTKHEPGKRANRRIAMLNKVFMKQISDLMSTGTAAMNIVGRGIEISKVQVTPDFQTVNVFWVCKGTSTDEETDSALRRIAGPLRHELSTLRVMGEIPYITFVKDKNEAQVVELDRLLSVIDYGEDFEPTEIGHLLKTEFTLNTKLSPEMKAKIKQLEDECQYDEDPIPEMTYNVYGLDHAKIMSRLVAARKKSKEAWVNVNADNSVISYRTPENKSDAEVNDERKQLADFLLKRQILQNKLRKELRDFRDEWQIQYKLDDDEPHDNDSEFDYEEEDEEDDYFYYNEIAGEDK